MNRGLIARKIHLEEILMMCISGVRHVACVALVVGFAHGASAADILIADAKSQPESLTAAPVGVLIVGSASSPFVYKVSSGSSTAEKFVDASAEGPGTFSLACWQMPRVIRYGRVS
jgi:hypothetical protein